MSTHSVDLHRGIRPFQNLPFGGISASTLKIIALLLMFLDHSWATIASNHMWLTFAGRLAFPIFAFQITEGFLLTSNRKQYAKRLLIFGLLSEIPFNYLVAASPIYPFHQNVMITFLLGLWAMTGLEKLRAERTWRSLIRCVLQILLSLLLATILFVDYGSMGVMTVLVFYIFRGFPFAWIGQLLGMTALHIVFFKGYTLLIPFLGKTIEFPTQGFAVLALIFIWLYNGKKGRGGKLLQFGCYAFYPLHMLFLYILAVLTR